MHCHCVVDVTCVLKIGKLKLKVEIKYLKLQSKKWQRGFKIQVLSCLTFKPVFFFLYQVPVLFENSKCLKFVF